MKIGPSAPSVVYVRCKSWRKWPSWREIESPLISADLGGQRIEFRFQIATYEQDAGDSVNQETAGPSTVVYVDDQPHLLSENIIVWDPNADNAVAYDRLSPECGEIDLRILVYSDEPFDFEVLEDVFPRFLHMLIAYFNYLFKDALIPVAPLQMVRPDSPGTVTCQPLPRVVRSLARSEYEEDFVKQALSRLAASSAPLSSTDLNILHVAARRMLAAQREEDLVDRYCDLWEVCEFLSQDVKAKGGKVGRIAQALSDCIGKPKAKIENGLGLRELFSIRGAVVHEGVEDDQALRQNIDVLEAIASQLFRSKLGLAYRGSQTIDRLLQ